MINLTAEKQKYYKAMRSRDPRNDGRFYIGVHTTGIYCRPTCPARPKIQNVQFYKSKAEAEVAGFRPCLRCRPDLSPLSPQWLGTAAVMSRALSLVEKNEFSLTEISQKLGMTDRHMRRLFHEHVGAAPIDIVLSRRLHLARQLLSQTQLTITAIAFASGFQSLRRFNDAFLKTYRMPPRSFRKEVKIKKMESDFLILELPYMKPYGWDHILEFFKRHEVFGVEKIDDKSYSRKFRTQSGENFYRVRNLEKKSCLQIELKIADLSDLRETIERIRSQFDLAHNPHHIEKVFKMMRDVRVPGAFDTFETAVGVILGQLVSIRQANENIKKLILKYGDNGYFPTPQILMNADFSGLGFTKARSAAIRELARMVHQKQIILSKSSDLEMTREKLLNVRGIGPWTVEIIALRCLSDPDAFPAKDLIVARALEKLKIQNDLYSPWRAYLALAMWKYFV